MSLTVSPDKIVRESGSPLVASHPAWPRRPLGEVASILNGFAFKSEYFVTDGGKLLVRIRDLYKDRTAIQYAGEYDERYVLRRGDLLVGMDGAFNCTRWRGPEALLNQRVCKITPDPAALDLDYLSYLLPGYLQAIHDYTSSTTVTHLSSRDIARIPIPLPSLSEQRALAHGLDELEGRRVSSSTHILAARRALERFRGAVLAAACSGRLTADWRAGHLDESAEPLVRQLERSAASSKDRTRPAKAVERSMKALDPSDLPESWEVVSLRLLIEPGRPITYGILKPGPDVPGGVSYVRVTDFKNGSVDLGNLRRTSPDIAAQYARSSLRAGDLLFAIRGSYGQVAVVPPELEGGNITQDTARLAIDPSVSKAYVSLTLRSPDIQRRVANAAKGVAVRGLNLGDLRELLVPLPPRSEQEKIVSRVDGLLKLADALMRRIDAASEQVGRTYLAILAKAVRGDLAVA